MKAHFVAEMIVAFKMVVVHIYANVHQLVPFAFVHRVMKPKMIQIIKNALMLMNAA